MTFTIPPGRHRPTLRQMLAGWRAGFYGISSAPILRRRVVFYRPAGEGVGGKLFGRSRGLGWPLRRLRYGTGELLKVAHEESDRFAFQCERWAIAISAYAYRRGIRPYADDAMSGQSEHLAILEYGRPYIFLIAFRRHTTRYAVYDEQRAVKMGEVTIPHDSVPLWRWGKLMGLYQGGKKEALREFEYSVSIEKDWKTMVLA